MKKSTLALLAAFATTAFSVSAEEGGEMPAEGEGSMHPPPYVGSPEFERMKALAGSWVVTEGMPKGEGAEGTKEMMVAASTASPPTAASSSSATSRTRRRR